MITSRYENSEIADWYSGKYIFITGATGFIGKILIEKLLRACPEIRKIYVLIRCKRGSTPEERLKQILNVPLFDSLRKENDCILDKIIPIEGDISKHNLSLSDKDWDEITKNCSVVFHSAANVKFDDHLKQTLEMNVLGSEQIIQLCYEMKKLEALIYVSTAYSNANLNEIQEKIYDPPYDLDKLKMWLDCLDDEFLDTLRPKVIKDRPNTYSFTKAMAESMMQRHSRNLPIAVIRPAIVVSTWKEPFEGWVDNLNGPAGILMFVGKGVIRTLIGNDECRADVIPADICINVMIGAAWYIATKNPANLMVYNCVGSGSNSINWYEIKTVAEQTYIKYPQTDVMFYPNGKFRPNILKHNILKIFMHLIPAILGDIVLRIIGKKPYLVQLEKKIESIINAMGYFTTHQWYFEKKNSEILQTSFSETDKKLFNTDFSQLDWKDLFEKYFLGVRIHVLKQGMDTVPAAKNRLRILKYLYYALRILLVVLLLGLLCYTLGLGNMLMSNPYIFLLLIFAAIPLFLF